jgi:hypothetical protein
MTECRRRFDKKVARDEWPLFKREALFSVISARCFSTAKGLVKRGSSAFGCSAKAEVTGFLLDQPFGC